MISGIQLKICGLTSVVDAEAAEAAGADYLGFVIHPGSPRAVTLDRFASLRRHLPGRQVVAVCVTPEPGALAALVGAGADRVQVHFPHTTSDQRLAAWSAEAGPGRLWLAPRLPPGVGVDPAWLAGAETFLMDTFDSGKFGGTGRTGDWEKFVVHRKAHPSKTWILSGGLSPVNIAGALAATGARFVDVNSGVEASPGVKNHSSLLLLGEAMRGVPAPA